MEKPDDAKMHHYLDDVCGGDAKMRHYLDDVCQLRHQKRIIFRQNLGELAPSLLLCFAKFEGGVNTASSLERTFLQ